MRNGIKSRTPGEAPGQRTRGAAFPWWVLGTLLVLAFGLWHLRDVRAGVIETGDVFPLRLVRPADGRLRNRLPGGRLAFFS